MRDRAEGPAQRLLGEVWGDPVPLTVRRKVTLGCSWGHSCLEAARTMVNPTDHRVQEETQVPEGDRIRSNAARAG